MKHKVYVGYAALCLGAGSVWLYDLFCPGILQGLPRTAVHNGVVALECLVWALWRRERGSESIHWSKLLLPGVFLFAVPDIMLAGASTYVTSTTEVLVFLLTPVVVVFWVGQQAAAFGTQREPLRELVPALVGLGGLALVLPFQMPASTAGRLWLMALVASAIGAGIAAVELHRMLAQRSLAVAGAVVFGACCLISAAATLRTHVNLPSWTLLGVVYEAVRLCVIDGPLLLLALWLVREMRPVAFASRLLLVPVVTVLEGIVAERPDVGWYGWSGLVLAIGAGIGLAMSRDENEAGAPLAPGSADRE